MLKNEALTKRDATKCIAYLALIVPLIPLEGLYYLNKPVYNIIYLIGAMTVASIVCVYWIIAILKGRKAGYATLLFAAMAMYNVVLTLVTHGDIQSVVGVWLYAIPAVLLLELTREHLALFLKVILLYVEFLLIVNLILIICAPGGMYAGDAAQYGKMWLLGYKSSLQCYVFPAVTIGLLFSAYSGKYGNILLILGISHLICVAESNGMLLMGLALFDFIVVTKLYRKKYISKHMMIIVAVGIVVANVIIVLYTNAFLSNHIVQYILYSVLKKNATLSLRTNNWAAVWPVIKQNPIMGYGFTTQEVRTAMYGRETAHAHNLFLELLYEGGILQLLMFLLLNISIMYRLYKNYRKGSSRIIFLSLIVFYIMYIFENVFRKTSSMIWLVFCLGYYTRMLDARLSLSKRNALGFKYQCNVYKPYILKEKGCI